MVIEVVAGIIHNDNNKILIAKRNHLKDQGNLYEFPGGKVEKNETYEDALIREIKEELEMDIIVLNKIGEEIFEYPEKKIKLIAFNAKAINRNIKMIEHEDLKWVNLNEIKNFNFAPADVYFVNKILNINK